MLIRVVYAATWSHVDVSGPCCQQEPWSYCSWESVLMPTVCSATGDCAEVPGRCCHQKPCESPWSMLLMHGKGKEMTFAMVLMTANSQLRKRNIVSVTNPTPPKSNSLDGKPSKRTLKNGEMDAEVWLSTVGGFWQGCGWEGLSFKNLAPQGV